MAEKENIFQKKLKEKIAELFPDCIILKNDPTFLTGIPDLVIFCNEKWAMLEVKKSADAPHRPHQDYWVERLNDMSFARFIYPENKEEVLNELFDFFKA